METKTNRRVNKVSRTGLTVVIYYQATKVGIPYCQLTLWYSVKLAKLSDVDAFFREQVFYTFSTPRGKE